MVVLVATDCLPPGIGGQEFENLQRLLRSRGQKLDQLAQDEGYWTRPDLPWQKVQLGFDQKGAAVELGVQVNCLAPIVSIYSKSQ